MTFSYLRDKIFENYQHGAITDEQLVQIIELASGYLNLKNNIELCTIRGYYLQWSFKAEKTNN